MDKQYNVVDGTSFDRRTPQAVVDILAQAVHDRSVRLRIWYGDTKTGRAWGDVETCYIGRSTGQVKIPLVIHNSRSTGGCGLLDHCIVRIDRKRGRQFYMIYQIVK